jgi:hypothetical protein
MEFCLDCHRDPNPKLRPKDQITSMAWHAPEDPKLYGDKLAAEYNVHARTSCTTCHR